MGQGGQRQKLCCSSSWITMTRSEQQQEQHTAQWYVRRHSRRLAGRPLACAWREQSKSKKERREKRERKKKRRDPTRTCLYAGAVGGWCSSGTGRDGTRSFFFFISFSPLFSFRWGNAVHSVPGNNEKKWWRRRRRRQTVKSSCKEKKTPSGSRERARERDYT